MEMLGADDTTRHEDAMQQVGSDGLMWSDLLTLLETVDAPASSKRHPELEEEASTTGTDTFPQPFNAMEEQVCGSEQIAVFDDCADKLARRSASPQPRGRAPTSRAPDILKQELIEEPRAVPSTIPSASVLSADPTAPGACVQKDKPFPLLEDKAQHFPTPSAAEIRRMKNREFMRGARRRHREELKRMKATVESLEEKYAELCLIGGRSGFAVSMLCPPLSAQQRAEVLYAQAIEVAKQLGAENLFLRATIRNQASWKLHLQSILGTLPDCTTPRGIQIHSSLGSFDGRTAGIRYLPLDTLDPDAAHSIFGFTPLTEEGVTALILDNSHQMNSVRTQLEALQRVGDSQLLSRQVFGWDVVQRVTQGSIMEFMFTKRFSGLSAREIMHGTWANDMELEKYRKVKCDVKRLEVLQEANANAYILGRDVRAPDNSTVFRSVFLRYLIETTQSLPNPRSRQRVADGSGSESEDTEVPSLKASGFILGTHSANRDWSQSGHASSNIPKLPDCDLLGLDDHEKLVWADLALSIEFLDVEDPVTGETYQRARWMGRTDYKSGTDALRNTADMLSGCLRWELLMISPALNLISLDLA